MNALPTLIRLQKRALDELRRELLPLEEKRAALADLLRNLRADYAKEQASLLESPENIGFFGDYAARQRQREDQAKEELRRIEKAITAKRDAIASAFSAQKTYEIAHARAEAKREATARRRQQERFDEIGTQQYLRSQRLE